MAQHHRLSEQGCSWASLSIPTGTSSPAAPTSSRVLELLQSHVPQVASEEDTVLDSEHKPKEQRTLLRPVPQVMHTAGITPGREPE